MSESPYDPPVFLETRDDEPPIQGTGYGHDYWVDGKTLVAKQAGIKLPDRCIKCNGARSGKRIRTRLFWHSPWLFFLILVNPIIYYLIAMHVRREAVVSLSLCQSHRSSQTIKSNFGYVLLFLTLVGFAAPFVGVPESMIIPAVLMGLVCLTAVVFWAAFAAPIVRAVRIQNKNVWIKGVGADYTRQIISDNFVPAGNDDED